MTKHDREINIFKSDFYLVPHNPLLICPLFSSPKLTFYLGGICTILTTLHSITTTHQHNMTSLANLIYAQTLYKYAVDHSIKSVVVSPDIPVSVAEYLASQLPKHPLTRANIIKLMGESPSLSAAECQRWGRQMIASTKIAEKELAVSSLAKLVDGFRHVLFTETLAQLKTDEATYVKLTGEMDQEEAAQKELEQKAVLEKEQKEKEEKELKEKEEKEKEQKLKEEQTVAPKSDDDDVEMVDAVEELKEPEEEEKEEVEEEKEQEPEEEAEEETEAAPKVVPSPSPSPVKVKEEEADVQAEVDDANDESGKSDKEDTADVEEETDRGDTEEPDESELDRVTETPEAATPGSEERTRKRARSTTEESDTRKRSRRNTSAAPSANRKFQNVAGNLLSNISSNKSASFFTHPVNPNSAPNYYALIFSPTDIRTIKAQVKDGRISSTSELEREVAKMFANAIMYNPWDSDVNVWAREMQQETDALLTLFRGAGGE